MVERGARHLVLLGRTKASDSAELAVAAMREMGCEVLTWQADVSHEDEVALVLTQIRESLPRLRGIIHAAGIVDDGIMLQLDQERFRRVMSPKVIGAWNLHRQSLDDPLDFFVLFSSLASMLGSAGQSNYAAANSFLDSLAYYRRSLGRPALSINWGPWADVGMAAVHREGLSRKGFESITSQEGMEVLERLLQAGMVQAGVLKPGAHTGAHTAGQQDASGLPVFRQQMDAAAPEEHWNLLLAHVRGEISRILGLDPTRPPELDRGLVDMGLDSLMAVELRQSLQNSTGHAFPIAAIFNHPTIAGLTSYLFKEVFSSEASAVSQAEAGPESAIDSVLNNLEQLSEDEALQLLTEALSR
jgi:acyl carrier protein